ncbi:MAG TPA: hypothetical protein VMI54_15450 [Polyangiaceae bacterium]|nr:hypothetical protein [Polyangiaceae bacterium]
MTERALRGLFRRILAGVAPVTMSLGLCSCAGSSAVTNDSTPDAGSNDPCAPAPVDTICPAYCVALAPDAGATPDADGGLPNDQCTTLCSEGPTSRSIFSCEVVAPETGGSNQRLHCQPNCTGRAPAGLEPCPQRAGLGGYFAEMARLEAASVVAFRRLAHELRAHGAPARLRRAARRAARDEVRHARSARTLAQRFGGTYRAPAVAPPRSRSLLGLLRENATEGAVREAFGALAAEYQARFARDGEVRRVMTRVAADETRHAELALAIERWAIRRLDGDARRELARSRRAAVTALFVELERDPPAEIAAVAGAPPRAVAKELAARLDLELWQA